MTIIKPNSNKETLGSFLLISLALFLAAGIIYIFEYTSFVKIRHEVTSLERGIIALEKENFDLKNELYGVIDIGNLKTVAMESDFLLEGRPIYLKSGE